MGVSSLSGLAATSESLGIQSTIIDYEGGESYRVDTYYQSSFPTQFVKIQTPNQGIITQAVNGAQVAKHYNYQGALTRTVLGSGLNLWVVFGALVFIAGVTILDWGSEEEMIWTFSGQLLYPRSTLQNYSADQQELMEDNLPSAVLVLVTNPDTPTIYSP